MSNFTFLKKYYKGLYQKMVKAERRVYIESLCAAAKHIFKQSIPTITILLWGV